MARWYAAAVRCAWLLLLLAGCAARPGPPSDAAALWLGGDVHLGARGDAVLEPLKALTGGEALVVNLEGPVGDGAERSSAKRLVNGPQAPGVLARAGVRVAGVENNHAGDLGVEGRAHTRAALEAAGLLIAAPPTPLSPSDAEDGTVGPARLVVGGVPVTMVAVDLTDGVPEGLAEALRATKRPGEVLVATFHVSAPGMVLPTEELETAVAQALHAGATVIAAHGTHVTARVERRGASVIAWGLGNLAFDCDCTEEGAGLLLRVAFAPDGRVARATVVPVDAGLHGAPVRPAADAALALDVLESLGSSPLSRTADRADF